MQKKHGKKKSFGLQCGFYLPSQGGYSYLALAIPTLPITGNQDLDRVVMFVGFLITGIGIAKRQKWL